MAEDQIWDDPFDEDEEEVGPVLARRPVSDTAEMDITPMIDITFLLLIFFLVCSTANVQTAVKLPKARHGTGVSERGATVITVANREGGPAQVHLGDGTGSEPLPDDEDAQKDMIRQAVEDEGNSVVLIKAERDVKHGDTWRVYSAVGQVEGSNLHVAVMEIE